MPYYLVSFTLTQNYFDASDQRRDALTAQEIDYGKKLFKVGIWKHAYTMPGKIKTRSWAIYQTRDEAELKEYLAGYPMARAAMYTSTTDEVTIVDPPRIADRLFSALRFFGLYKPWKVEAWRRTGTGEPESLA